MQASPHIQAVPRCRAAGKRYVDAPACDAIGGTPQRVAAIPVFREPAAANVFNPEGITFRGIQRGLYDNLHAQRERLARALPCAYIDAGAAATGCPPVAPRMGVEPTPEYLIQPGDEARARFVRDTPLALLMSVEHQDAVARWHYAVLHGAAEVRTRAAGLIKDAVARRQGRVPRHSTDPDALAQAYFDLVAYLWAVRRCIDKGQTAETLRRYFPDCDDAWAAMGTRTEERIDRNVVRISPPTAALTILGQMVGLKRSRLQALLKPYRARVRAS